MPCSPCGPSGPWGPVAPVAPVGPVGPGGPCGPVLLSLKSFLLSSNLTFLQNSIHYQYEKIYEQNSKRKLNPEDPTW